MSADSRWLTRPQASEYLANKLPFKTVKQWASFLANNRTSKEVYTLKFKLMNGKIMYGETTLKAFIRSMTHTY
ncbi:hypothetical protein HLH12_11725 [Acinetobacter sp. NIPH 2377]|uniref:hypothetical protein n=1 Tax=Acinetobacter terrestris TaxID=2529843 RepID=UPI0014900B9B|nr:hypothetical protein [Acinetobacter terrestris]NNH36202.1 hypothetical protein [Acinetobacter terrestris]